MKKRSIGLVLLSALLCLSMLLISCSEPEPAETEATNAPEVTQAPTVYPTPVDVKVDYEAIMAKWNEYVTFANPNADTEDLSDKVFLFADAEDDNITMKRYGIFLLVTEMHTRTVPAEFDYLPDKEITTGFTYTVYNMKTGKKIINEFVSYDEESTRNAEFEVKVARYNSTYLPVLEVRKGIYVDGTDDEGFITYTYTETYSYVDENGNIAKEGVAYDDRPVIKQESDNTYRIEIDDNIYTYSSLGEYVYTFKKGSEKLIPKVDFTYGSYMYISNPDSIVILDKDYNRLCGYTFESDYDNSVWYILSNGNILVNYKLSTSSGLIQKFVILNVTTGETTEFKKDFVIDYLTTAFSGEAYGIGFKGSYQLAVIDAIEDGYTTGVKSFVILDNSLEVVAELPTFVKAQDSIVGMRDESKLVITANNIAGDRLFYAVDVKDATVAPYINLAEFSYQPFENGFIYNSKIYNNDCVELLDTEDHSLINVYDGFVICYGDSGYDLCYIENGALVKKSIISGSGSYSVEGDYIKVEDYYDYYYTPDESTSEESTAETTGDDYYDDYSGYTIYKVFNLKGVELASHSTNVQILSSGDGFVFYKVVDEYNNTENYYILK